MPRFVSIGLFCCPLAPNPPIFAVFWTSTFSDGGNLRKLNTSAHNYITTSAIQRHQNCFCTPTPSCEIGRTISDVQQRGGQTDKQTKTQRFWLTRRRVKSKPHQTWHGERGPRARSCTSQTFGDLTHSFAARGRWKFGRNQTPQLKTPITP